MLKAGGTGFMCHVARPVAPFREEFDRERIKELVSWHQETAPMCRALT